eukprot:scaffold3374_cov387-Prasinococcus_capsulatus_cf.AAC.3
MFWQGGLTLDTVWHKPQNVDHVVAAQACHEGHAALQRVHRSQVAARYLDCRTLAHSTAQTVQHRYQRTTGTGGMRIHNEQELPPSFLTRRARHCEEQTASHCPPQQDYHERRWGCICDVPCQSARGSIGRAPLGSGAGHRRIALRAPFSCGGGCWAALATCSSVWRGPCLASRSGCPGQRIALLLPARGGLLAAVPRPQAGPPAAWAGRWTTPREPAEHAERAQAARMHLSVEGSCRQALH